MSAELTPQELAELRMIRGRAMMDRGDIAPMLLVSTVREAGRDPAVEVIPWLDALNMEITP